MARQRRARQTVLPGTEEQYVPEVTDAVLAYVEARDQRMALTVEETDAQEELQRLMKEHRLKRYVTPEGLTAVLVEASACKVKVSKPRAVEVNGEED